MEYTEEEIFILCKNAIIGTLDGIIMATQLKGQNYVPLEELIGVAQLIANATEQDIASAMDRLDDQFEPSEASIEELLKRLGE